MAWSEPTKTKNIADRRSSLVAFALFSVLVCTLFGIDMALHHDPSSALPKLLDGGFFAEMLVVFLFVVLPALLLHVGFGRGRRQASPSLAEPTVPGKAPATAGAEPKSPGSASDCTHSKLSRWNQAIYAAAKTGDISRAEALLEELCQDGLEPDAVSFNSLIHACAKKGDIRRAVAGLGKMREKGVVPNTISFNILMDACVKANDAAGAETWLEKMVGEGVQPNEVSYATVIHGYAKCGDTARAEHFLRQMTLSGVEPNAVCFNSLIAACGRAGSRH